MKQKSRIYPDCVVRYRQREARRKVIENLKSFGISLLILAGFAAIMAPFWLIGWHC